MTYERSKNSDAYVTIDLVGRYETGQIELEGTPTALLQLAELLLGKEPTAHYTLRVPEGSASPYDGYLSAIQIMRTEAMTNIGQQGDTLVITGSPESLSILSDNLRSLAQERMTDSIPGYHLHIEYYPDHFFLTPNAIPLIVVCQPETSRADESEIGSN